MPQTSTIIGTLYFHNQDWNTVLGFAIPSMSRASTKEQWGFPSLGHICSIYRGEIRITAIASYLVIAFRYLTICHDLLDFTANTLIITQITRHCQVEQLTADYSSALSSRKKDALQWRQDVETVPWECLDHLLEVRVCRIKILCEFEWILLWRFCSFCCCLECLTEEAVFVATQQVLLQQILRLRTREFHTYIPKRLLIRCCASQDLVLGSWPEYSPKSQC